jgi:hypothetical protein
MGGICSRSSTQKNQQLLAICSSDSRQVPQYSRGIAERVLAMSKGVGGLALDMSGHLFGLNQRDQPPACWSHQQGALNIRATRASHKYSLCWCGKDGAVSAGTVPHVRIGCLDSEADRPKSFFLQKDKKGLAKLNRRKGCYLAADSFLDRIIRGLVPGEAGDSWTAWERCQPKLPATLSMRYPNAERAGANLVAWSNNRYPDKRRRYRGAASRRNNAIRRINHLNKNN